MTLSFSFCDKNKDFTLLKKLLQFLKADKYQWILGDSDVYNYSTLENIFKTGEYIEKEYAVYSGSELMSLISDRIFYVFIELYAFESVNSIRDYNDESLLNNCEIAVIIDDCNYYTVYVREKELFESLLSFLKTHNIDVSYQSGDGSPIEL